MPVPETSFHITSEQIFVASFRHLVSTGHLNNRFYFYIESGFEIL